MSTPLDVAQSSPVEFDFTQANASESAVLVITGHRRNRRHVVFIHNRPVLLSSRLFEELLELVTSRFTTRTGYRSVPSTQVDLEYVRLQIHRLRRAIDQQTDPGTGNMIVETGVGTVYRLAVSRDEIGVDESFYELPRASVSVGLCTLFRDEGRHVQIANDLLETQLQSA